MHPLIVSNLPQILELCRQHRVRSLHLFGSLASGAFDPARSDADFLVEFEGSDLGPWMKRFFDFQQALEGLLGRRVDLILAGSARNPYFAKAIEAQKVPIYAAA